MRERMQNANFLISKLFCKEVQCDFHFSSKVVQKHLFTVRPSMMKKITLQMLNDKVVRAAGIKAHHVARFNDTIAVALPLYTWSATAGIAIQGAVPAAILLYVAHIRR